MKPLYLGLEAFGPFVDYQAINFTDLGDAPLFLINGATGSGKSTLLDALCFALFGLTSGNERNAGQMRCDFADNNTIASVNCIFELAGKRYKIERIPTQERAKARGEGTTTQSTEATLWQIDNHATLERATEGQVLIAKSATKVTQWVEATLGLDAQQFRQVMILPQGKFRDFLLADSSEREKIFASLFQTAIYQQLQDALAENARGLEKQFEANRIKKEQLLTGSELESEDELPEILATQQTQLAELQAKHQTALAAKEKATLTLEQANTLLAQFTAFDKAQAELNQLTAEQQTIDDQKALCHRINEATLLAPKYEHLTEANAYLEQLTTSILETEQALANASVTLAEHEKALSDAETEAAEVPALEEKLSTLKQLQPKAAELHELAEQLAALNEQTKNISSQQNKKQASLQEQQQTFENEHKALAALEHKIALEAQTQQLIYSLQQQRELTTHCQQTKEKITTLERSITDSQTQLDRLTQQGEAARDHVKALQLAWHQSQAAILASELQLGLPCPVCGSKDHPAPAQKDAEAVDEQVWNDAEAKYQELRDAYSACKQTLQHQQQQLEQTQQEYQELTGKLKALINTRPSAQTFNQISEQLQQATAQLDACQQAKNERPALQAKIQRTQQTVETLKHDIQQLAADSQAVAAKFNYMQEQHQQLAHEIAPQFRQSGQLTDAIKELSADIHNKHNALKNCQEQLQTSKLQCAQLQSQLQERMCSQQMQQQKVSELTSQWQAALSTSLFEDQAAFTACLAQKQDQAALQQRITAFEKALEAQQTKCQTLSAQLQAQSKPDIAQLEHTAQLANAAYQQALSEWTNADHQLKSLQQLQKSLQRLAKDSESLDAQYATVGTLAEVANGKKGQKISLQRFVLGVLLDDVLIEASHRLLHMSKGRYRLLRNLERAKGNKASGLEIFIEDNYTGKTRSAATLSGGESFMAALSLALGLSDVVQAYAGGIQLDALFIDEGFGSLDTDALDLAIHTLQDLQSSGKMIGLISHVTELKEQMAQRIDIVSLPTGSQIKIICI